MCLAGELLWKRAAPEPFPSDQSCRVVSSNLLQDFRALESSSCTKYPSFLSQEMRDARPGGE